MGEWVFGFLGWAFFYSACASAAIFFCALVWQKKITVSQLLLLFFTLNFVFLTQHPFPSRGQLSCPVATASPQLIPFAYWSKFLELYRRSAPSMDWLTNELVAEAFMNFAIFGLIGIALALSTPLLRKGVIFGLTLSLGMELTQLTGIWGIYPCPYRKFSVDDIILNLAGTIFGFLICRALYRLMAR